MKTLSYESKFVEHGEKKDQSEIIIPWVLTNEGQGH